jgi:hypothetical protein
VVFLLIQGSHTSCPFSQGMRSQEEEWPQKGAKNAKGSGQGGKVSGGGLTVRCLGWIKVNQSESSQFCCFSALRRTRRRASNPTKSKRIKPIFRFLNLILLVESDSIRVNQTVFGGI